ncbi:MAG: FAD-dependent thymidylate synthase [Nitrospirota bacterium]|nr:FAD-dependent thymidylate synthase [Nitrospirota bacterium]
MATYNEGTREISEEIAARCAANPEFARRLGDFGFIELEDTWGDETTILNTARVSTSNRRLRSTADLTEKDRNLLFHLLSQHHGTPFETVYFRFRFIAPIFVLRQWVKHRISTWNEFSMRYRKPISAYYVPDPEAVTVDGFPVLTPDQIDRYAVLMEQIFQFYETEYRESCLRIDSASEQGLLPGTKEDPASRNPYRARARELLRSAIPVSAYSDVYWTVNFRSLMNFFDLRTKDNAQYEIRQYALLAYELFSLRFPLLSDLYKKAGGGSGCGPD